MANLPENQTQEHCAEEAADTVLQKYRKQSLVGFAVLLLGLAFALYSSDKSADDQRQAVVDSGQATAIASCNRDFQQAQRARQGLRDDKRESLKQLALFVNEGTLTEAQGRRAEHVTKKQTRQRLKDTPLPDCRVAGETLTSDPDDDIKIPTPLYPKD